jgi:hypothetical protein
MGLGGQRHSPAALLPVKTRYPLYRRLVGSHGRSGRARKFSPPPGFDPQTVQPVASRYTDRAKAAYRGLLYQSVNPAHVITFLQHTSPHQNHIF